MKPDSTKGLEAISASKEDLSRCFELSWRDMLLRSPVLRILTFRRRNHETMPLLTREQCARARGYS